MGVGGVATYCSFARHRPDRPARAARASAGAGDQRHTSGPWWGRAPPSSDPREIADAVAAYRELGADELVFYCYADDPGQVEDLAALACG